MTGVQTCALPIYPTVINGGIINAYGTNARLGEGDWMVVESDESDGSFLRLPATIAVVTKPFSFEGETMNTKSAKLAVQPMQKPHPDMWMQSRDPETLEFCAKNGINTGYFIVFPRHQAAPRYRKFLDDWNQHDHGRKPNIAYSTVVYVDESDDKACEVALKRASRAYEGLLPLAGPGETFEDRLVNQRKRFEARGEFGAAKIMSSMFDPDFIMQNELMFIGSPRTVTEKILAASKAGLFNTFMGEFNFSDLPESDLLRSIRLFGEKVLPELRPHEPF